MQLAVFFGNHVGIFMMMILEDISYNLVGEFGKVGLHRAARSTTGRLPRDRDYTHCLEGKDWVSKSTPEKSTEGIRNRQ